MPKIACRCGHIMVIGILDEDFAYSIISQNALWDIMDVWTKKSGCTSEVFLNSFNSKTAEVYECPSCKRLLVEESPNSNIFSFYIKDTDKDMEL